MSKAIICGFLLTLCGLVQPAFAQDKPSWLREVELLLRKEPRWRVQEVQALGVPELFNETIILKSGPLRADVSIGIRRSAEWAKDEFEQGRIAFTDISRKTSRQSRLPDLGDDNYMLVGKKKRNGSIFFRKDNVLVTVFAPSVETAKRFARYVADRIPPLTGSFE
ncbi:MAG TPA: hypothetical protein VGX92_18620 [Pyrinomonadaceae bacterium]|jgi:hypothetical protein|nr:hypothetical protein [Pyrinomonadaceae bacterium]